MKNLSYLFFLSVAVSLVACSKNITDLNDNPKNPEIVPSAALFTNASVNLSDVMASTNVNTNNFRLFAQYWTETIYRDEVRFNLNGRSIPDRWWAAFYRDVIKDLAEASTVAETETLTLKAGQIKNRKAINDILTVFAYYQLISTFGNVPYTEATNIDNIQPKYDDATGIFTAIATKLEAALSALDPNEEAYGASDVLLKGDIDRWITFGNSLKFRMGMLVVDSDFNTAKTMILAAASHVVASNEENIKMIYSSSPPNTNPVWEELVQSGRHDFIATKPFIDSLKAFNDPRMKYFFDPSTSGDKYVGQVPGNRAAFNDFATPSATLADQIFPHTFFSYAEMELLKAEAVERGIAVGGTAAEHYNNAIDASVAEWGGTPAEASAYRSQSSVAYATAKGTYKQKIGLQSWFVLYNRGYDAWTQWRRLDYPILNLPAGAGPYFADDETPAVITRMTYPVVEQNLNKANYEAASSAIGKDRKTQKLWFDKF